MLVLVLLVKSAQEPGQFVQLRRSNCPGEITIFNRLTLIPGLLSCVVGALLFTR